MTSTVKYFTNVMQGAPQLYNDFGCMTKLLDACLVDGFNLRQVQTLTYADGVATCTVVGGHQYKVGQWLLVEGVEQPEYEGEIQVRSVTTNTFTYVVTGNPTSPALGTITVKVAPLGFERRFSEGSKRAYRSVNPLSKGIFLRVDDGLAPGYDPVYAKKAKVGMAQGMTDINTVEGIEAPFDPLNPYQNWVPTGSGGGIYDGWYKWYYAKKGNPWEGDTSGPQEYNRPWVLVGDDRGFYLFNEIQNDNGHAGRIGYCFTDFESYRQSDPYNTMLAATTWYSPASTAWGWGSDVNNWFNRSLDYTGKILLRDHTLLGGNQSVGFAPLNTNNGQTISGRATGIPFPNPVDYSLILHPVHLMQASAKGLRGKMPGLMWVHNDNPLQDLEVVSNVVGYPGRKFLMVRMNYNNEGACSVMAMDITGPWW